MSNLDSFENLPHVMTVPQVADFLRLSVRMVYNLVRNGDLKAIHAGRAVRILKTQLEEFLDAGGTK